MRAFISAPSAGAAPFSRSNLFVLAVFIACAVYYSNGFGPGDAERYLEGAFRWLDKGFYLGENHWELRHLFVLPIALSFKAFGPGEFAATIPNLLYAGGLVAITLYFARRHFGEAEGVLAASFVAVSAFFMARPLELEVYGAEAFFAVLSVWLYATALTADKPLRLYFAAGVIAGLAWSIREQTVYLMLILGVITPFLKRGFLAPWFALGAGFAIIILGEWLFYTIAGGDPFYRYRIDLQHRTTGVPVELTGAAARPEARILRPLKDLLSYATTTPFLVLAAFAALLLRGRLAPEAPSAKRTLLLFGLMAVGSMAVTGIIFNLAFPRYYPVLTYFLLLILALATASFWRSYGRIAGGALGAIVVAANLAAADFSRYGEYAEARFLANVAATSEEPIYTDPLTASRGRYLLRLAGFEGLEASRRVRQDDAVPVGGLFFRGSPAARVKPDWCVIEANEVRRNNWTHALIRESGLDHVLGAKIRSIVKKPLPVELIRIVEPGASIDPRSGNPCLPPSK
jgi:4-amino-4-deoxy-L-arabinose transferase-like glycosyltransferase